MRRVGVKSSAALVEFFNLYLSMRVSGALGVSGVRRVQCHDRHVLFIRSKTHRARVNMYIKWKRRSAIMNFVFDEYLRYKIAMSMLQIRRKISNVRINPLSARSVIIEIVSESCHAYKMEFVNSEAE